MRIINNPNSVKAKTFYHFGGYAPITNELVSIGCRDTLSGILFFSDKLTDADFIIRGLNKEECFVFTITETTSTTLKIIE